MPSLVVVRMFEPTRLRSGLNALFKEISKMEKKEIGSKVFTDYKDRFQWFISLAIILLIIETLMKRKKKINGGSKINLFEDRKLDLHYLLFY